MLTPTILRSIDDAVLCWLATADDEGRPSVSPKEVFAALAPDRVVIADIASPRSIRNIARQGRVCVAVVDVFAQRGHQLYGDAQIVEPTSPRWAELSAPLEAITGGEYPFHRVIEVTVDKVHPIVAPSYVLHPEVDDEQRRASALRRYGVRPAD